MGGGLAMETLSSEERDEWTSIPRQPNHTQIVTKVSSNACDHSIPCIAEVPRPLSTFFHIHFGQSQMSGMGNHPNLEKNCGSLAAGSQFQAFGATSVHNLKDSLHPVDMREANASMAPSNPLRRPSCKGGRDKGTHQGYVMAQPAIFEAPVATESLAGLDSLVSLCTSRPGEGMASDFWTADEHHDIAPSKITKDSFGTKQQAQICESNRQVQNTCNGILFGAVSHHPLRRDSSTHLNLQLHLTLPRLAYYDNGPDTSPLSGRMRPVAGSGIDLLGRVLAAEAACSHSLKHISSMERRLGGQSPTRRNKEPSNGSDCEQEATLKECVAEEKRPPREMLVGAAAKYAEEGERMQASSNGTLDVPYALTAGGDPLAWCSEKGPAYFARLLTMRVEDLIRSRGDSNAKAAAELPREIDFVRDAIFALRGIPSNSFFLRADEFARSNNRTNVVMRRLCLSNDVSRFDGELEKRHSGGAIRCILQRFAKAGTAARRLSDFVECEKERRFEMLNGNPQLGSIDLGPRGADNFTNKYMDRHVMYAFACGVENLLSQIFSNIASLQEEIISEDRDGQLSNGKSSTLLALHESSQKTQRQLLSLAQICGLGGEHNNDSTKFDDAPALLSHLYACVQSEVMIDGFDDLLQEEGNEGKNNFRGNVQKLDTVFMAEYLFRASITPWMADLTSNIFGAKLGSEHARTILNSDRLSREYISSPHVGPRFLDLSLRIGISRATWSMRILRFAPQDVEMELFSLCQLSSENASSSVCHICASPSLLGRLPFPFHILDHGATRLDISLFVEKVSKYAALRNSQINRLGEDGYLKHKVSQKESDGDEETFNFDQMALEQTRFAPITPQGRAQARRLRRVREEELEEQAKRDREEAKREKIDAKRRRALLTDLEMQIDSRRRQQVEQAKAQKELDLRLQGDILSSGISGDTEEIDRLRKAARKLLLKNHGEMMQRITQRRNLAQWRLIRSQTLKTSRLSLQLLLSNKKQPFEFSKEKELRQLEDDQGTANEDGLKDAGSKSELNDVTDNTFASDSIVVNLAEKYERNLDLPKNALPNSGVKSSVVKNFAPRPNHTESVVEKCDTASEDDIIKKAEDGNSESESSSLNDMSYSASASERLAQISHSDTDDDQVISTEIKKPEPFRDSASSAPTSTFDDVEEYVLKMSGRQELHGGGEKLVINGKLYSSGSNDEHSQDVATSNDNEGVADPNLPVSNTGHNDENTLKDLDESIPNMPGGTLKNVLEPRQINFEPANKEEHVNTIERKLTKSDELRSLGAAKAASLEAVVQACILEPLRLQVSLIDAATLVLFKSPKRINIMGLLRQMRAFMFMGNGYIFHEVSAAVWRMMLLSDVGLTGLTSEAKSLRIESRVNDIIKSEGSSGLDAMSRNIPVRFKYIVNRSKGNEIDSISPSNRDAATWDPYRILNYNNFIPDFPINFPEDAIVCAWSLNAYKAAHQNLFLMNVTHQALRDAWAALKVAAWDDLDNYDGGNSDGDYGEKTGNSSNVDGTVDKKHTVQSKMGLRWLHILRGEAQFCVRSLQERASNALYEAWGIFETTAKDCPHVPGLHEAHRTYVSRVAEACFALDDGSQSILRGALQSCLSAAHVIISASKSERQQRRNIFLRAATLKDELVSAVHALRNCMDPNNPLFASLRAY